MNKISINQEDCIGCGLCETYNAEVFKIDDTDIKAKIKTGEGLADQASLELSAESLEKTRQAEADCPTKAIKIE